jgi:aminopeptidase N
MIVNDGTTTTRPRTIGLTSHEIAHTYFPFFMGTNEKKYAWMDEGWAVMLNFDFQNRMSDGINQISRELRTYSLAAGRDIDLPMMIPSIYLKGRSYRNAAYSRPAIAYYFLNDLMGDDKFKEALHLFMDRWNGKHPIPYDFFYTFDQVYGENLSWFWIPWFFESGYADLAIKEVLTNDEKTEIIIEKIGLLPVPIKMKVVYSDDSVEDITHTAKVWQSGSHEYRITVENVKEIVKIEMGDNYIPDMNKEDNIYPKE